MSQLKYQNKHYPTGINGIDDADPYQRIFGATAPRNLPETIGWFKSRQKDVYAMADDAELGLPSAMTTITFNDSSPEMLAAMRRGPLAPPTEQEMTQYLELTWSEDKKHLNTGDFTFEHNLSFNRRLYALKKMCGPQFVIAMVLISNACC